MFPSIKEQNLLYGTPPFFTFNHSWRKSKKFNGKTEHGVAPIELSGDDILLQLENLNDVKFGKHPSRKKKKKKTSPQ